MCFRFLLLCSTTLFLAMPAVWAGGYQRAVREATIQLNAPPQTVLSLLDPVGESKWAEGWEIRRIYPPEGTPEKGFIFATTGEEGVETVWMISDLNRTSRTISYVLVTPESKLGQIDISLESTPDQTTRAKVRYIYTALTPKGNEFVAGFTEEKFTEKMHLWQTAINHYLQTGRLFRHHH
jgi:hypothetical protein